VVYPAATRISHGVPEVGGSVEGLEKLLECSSVLSELGKSKDATDAVICVLAAADFLDGRAIAPHDKELALSEGWIWSF
jgi:hypothetical protein